MPETPPPVEVKEGEPLVPYVSLIITPGMEPFLIEAPARLAESLVLVTNTLGSLPMNLHDTVRAIVVSGKPVFCVPDTLDTSLELGGDLERQTQALGVTYVPGINVMSESELCRVIKEFVAKGLKGTQLRDAVLNVFSTASESSQ